MVEEVKLPVVGTSFILCQRRNPCAAQEASMACKQSVIIIISTKDFKHRIVLNKPLPHYTPRSKLQVQQDSKSPHLCPDREALQRGY